MYKLTVTKLEENQDYDTQLKNAKNQYINAPYPNKFTEQRKLEVELKDEEYDVIKKAVLSTFK